MKHGLYTRTMLLVCSSLTTIMPMAAHAEVAGSEVSATAAEDVAATLQATEATQIPDQGAATDNASTSDIVVTALRNRQSLQKTSAAVTVASGELLERAQIEDVRGLQALVPAARIAATYSSTKIFIRGVGSLLDFYWIPELTATNFNGVYMPRFTINGAMYDIDAVQILPGPQGVLYGRSAGGGAVLINTRKPVFKQEAAASIEIGNLDSVRAEAMINLPVSDSFALRAAGFVSRRDGYESNNMASDDSAGIRLSALWEPDDKFSLYLWGTHYRQDGVPIGTQYYRYVDPDRPWFIPSNDPLTGNNNSGGFDRIRYSILGYEAKYNLGGAEVSYRGSYMRQTEKALTKLTGNDRVVDNGQKQYTQDLSISGNVGKLALIGGFNYFHADSRYNVLFGPRQFGNIFPEINNDSFSVFGQGTFSLTDTVRLIGGARWSRDHLDLDGTGSSCFATCSYPPITFSKTWHHADWKAGAEFDVAPDVMLYGNVQTGYAPGTLNTFTNATILSKEISPQKLLAYTAGLKSQLMDRKIIFNLEVYNYDYKKLIIQAFNSQVGAQSLFNVPKARVHGGQITLGIKPWTGGSFTGNVAYTHGRYGSFQTSPVARNLNGLQMQFAPDWTGAIAFDQRFEMANGSHVDARISTYFSSSYWGTFDHTGNARQDSYHKSDASITWYAPEDKVYLGLWVRNIENEDTATSVSALSTAVPPYTAAVFLDPPRTYGIKAGFKF